MKLLETTDTTYRLDRDGVSVTLPRVTSILSLVHRFDGIPIDRLAHASDRGRAVHRGVWILAGGDPTGLAWSTVHPEVRPYLEAYLEARRVLGFMELDKEILVWSQPFWFAGRADLIVEGLDPALTVLDLKSGVEHWTHALQTAAYCEGYRAVTGTRRRLDRKALYLRPDGKYKLERWPDQTVARDFKDFCRVRDAYLVQQARGGRNGN